MISFAQSQFSHKQLMGKSSDEMQEMMFQNGINWSKHYSPRFKNGVLMRKVIVEVPFTTEEIDKLPAKHAARNNPELKIKRQVVSQSFDVLTRIPVDKRVGFIFGKELNDKATIF